MTMPTNTSFECPVFRGPPGPIVLQRALPYSAKGRNGEACSNSVGSADGLDVDARRAYELTEWVRLLCDCGNCVGNRLCSDCPALCRPSRGNTPGRRTAWRSKRYAV